MKRRLGQIGALAAVLLAMGGCAQYAPVAAQGTTRIAVAPVINESALPQVIAPLARNVRERLAHAPQWQLVPEPEAEAVLRLTVSNQTGTAAMARDPADTGRPLSFLEVVVLTLAWDSALPPPWGGDPVIQVEADALVYGQPSRIASEQAAIQDLADGLARKVLEQLSGHAADPGQP